MEIEIEGRRVLLHHNWSRSYLQDHLLKSSLTLTKVDADVGQQVTATHSLAVCLLQHALGRYTTLRTLGQTWQSMKDERAINCDESDWIMFCQFLYQKHRKVTEFQQEKEQKTIMKGEKKEVTPLAIDDLQLIVKGVVEAFEKFKWLGIFDTPQNAFRVGCVIGGQVIEIVAINDESSESPSMCRLVWYDQDSGIFHGITKWRDTFEDGQAYRIALSCQLAEDLKDFYRFLLTKGKPGDDELEMRSLAYLRELNQQLDRNVEDHLTIIEGWDATSEASSGLKIKLNELLDPSFEGDQFEINFELRQQFIESLEKAYDQVQIARREAYEKARLKAIKDREEDERNERQFKLEIEAATAEIQLLEQEIEEDERAADQHLNNQNTVEQIRKNRYRQLWQSARYKVLEASNRKKPMRFIGAARVLIMQKRELLKSKTEQLEWDRFRLLLRELPPPYEVAKFGRKHSIFTNSKNRATADVLLEHVLEELKLVESFKKRRGDIPLLYSFARQNSSSVLAEMYGILDKMVTEPINSTSGQTWKFNGSALLLSQIYEQWSQKNSSTSGNPCEEIIIEASRVIYIDHDWVTPGLSVSFSAPRVEAIGTGILRRVIDTSGKDAKSTTVQKAKDGLGDGLSGDDGEHGEAGQSAGHVTIHCDSYLGIPLIINAQGGNGSDGQSGGDGKPGYDGQNGRDGVLQPRNKVNQEFDFIPLRYYWNFPSSIYEYWSGKVYNTAHFVAGEPGTPGKAGGTGGSAGCGGQGGYAGTVELDIRTGNELVNLKLNKNGEDGKDGKPGTSAKGGKGGRNGLDCARVFEPDSDSLDPWFWVAGKWRENKGKLKIESVMRKSNRSEQIGSRIQVVSADNGRATDGHRGEDGQAADQSHQKTSTPKREMAETSVSWRSDAAATALVSSQLQRKEAAVKKLGAAISNSDEAARRARAAAKQQEANEKKLKHAEESEKRMRKAFQLAKTQSSAQLMRTTQRTQTISTHQPGGTGELTTRISNREGNEFILPTIQILAKMQIATQSEWNALEGVTVLDTLIANFSNGTLDQVSETLSLLTQSIVLRIYLTDPTELQLFWSSLVKIIRRSPGNADRLIRSLRCVSQDIDLIQEIFSSKQESLLEPMKDAILKKAGQQAWDIVMATETKPDIIGVLCAFHHLAWDYTEIQKLLMKLLDSKKTKSSVFGKSRESIMSDNPVRGKLVEYLRDKLIDSVAKAMTTPTMTDDKGKSFQQADETMIESQVFVLKSLFHLCSSASASADGFPAATFFDELMKKVATKTGDDFDLAMTKFVYQQLGIKKASDLMMSSSSSGSSFSFGGKATTKIDDEEKRLEKLRFVLSNTKVSVDELDAIRRAIEKRQAVDQEPFNKIYALTEQAFVNYYWTREWESFHDTVRAIKENKSRGFDQEQAEILQKEPSLDEFQLGVDRLKAALMWTHSGKSYADVIEVCIKLKKMLNNSDWSFNAILKQASEEKETPLMKCMQFVREQENRIVGAFEKSGNKEPLVDSKDSFMAFVWRLQTIAQPTKTDRESMAPQFRKALHYLDNHRTVPLTIAELQLCYQVFDKKSHEIFKDENIGRDFIKLKTEYLDRFPDHYFLRWIDNYEEMIKIQREISTNLEVFLNKGKTEDPKMKLMMRRMNILLNRYAVLTTFFQSPEKCLKEWKSLQQMEMEGWDQQLKARAVNNFGNHLKKMIDDIETDLNHTKRPIAASNSGAENGQTLNTETERCLSIIDTLLTSNCLLMDKNPSGSSSMSSTLSVVALLLECLVDLDDTNAEKIKARLEKWKASLVTMDEGENSTKFSASIRSKVAAIFDIVDWSIISDGQLCETLSLRSNRHRKIMEDALQRQKTFTQIIQHLTQQQSMNDDLCVIRATVRYFGEGEDLSPWSLSCHKNENLPLLIEKQVDIWNDCCTVTEFCSKSRDALAFLDVLLSSTSGDLLKTRISLATQLLVYHIDTPENVDVLEQWTQLVNQLTTRFNTQVESEEELDNRLIELQASLISHIDVFQTRKLRLMEETDQLRTKICSKMVTDQLTVLARLLGKSKSQSNCLLITGLGHLIKTLDECVRTGKRLVASSLTIQIIQHLFRNEAVKRSNVKMKAILDVIYSLSDHGFHLTEKGFLERFIQTETCCHDMNMVVALYDKINQVIKGKADQISPNTINRFMGVVDLKSLLNDTEKRYLAVLGNTEFFLKMLHNLPPSAYLSSLKESALNQTYRKLIHHFYPENDEDLTDLLATYKPKTNEDEDVEKQERGNPEASDCKLQVVKQFQKSFNRAYFFVKRDNVELEWLLWLQETVLKSLESTAREVVTLTTVTQLVSASATFKLDELFYATVTARPYQWLDNILVNSILKAIDKLDPANKRDHQPDKQNAQRIQLRADLHECLRSTQFKCRNVLEIFVHKLEQESRLVAATESVDLTYVAQLVKDLKTLKQIDDVDRFQGTSLKHWTRLVRHCKLTEIWPSGLANQIVTTLDNRVGQERADRFLEQFKIKYCQSKQDVVDQHNAQLEGIMKNLSKYPWIVDSIYALTRVDNLNNGEIFEDEEFHWQHIQSKEVIEQERSKASRSNLSVAELFKLMRNDPENEAMIGGRSREKTFESQINQIVNLATSEPRNKWMETDIDNWVASVKKSQQQVTLVEFLSVAYRAVQLKMNCQLRESQMLAVLMFATPSGADRRFQRKMAQISTGEGKTLITALLVVYHVLSNWSNGRRLVDIITSSPVLAVDNVIEMQWFYKAFGVDVENNCDSTCSDDENIRRKRYNTDVVYGDLSSFQRDILLSRFFSDRDITCNREAGAVVVDEVDSMLLDKGENILYLSHKIPEMDDLVQVFVEIWHTVHDPQVAVGDERAQAIIYGSLKERIENGEIRIPRCLESFVLRYLPVWTSNAFRAKKVTTKDAYKVDDVGDGRGQQIVIMDKETGVEQVQMQWSHGLHQFLQLKHALKLSSVSLKAVFMSNVGFFEQRKSAALYGMTGTLGSTAECKLLAEVFQVEFFKMPRFRRRFCLEEDHLLSPTKSQWLENLVIATQSQMDAKRAVLIVCENIASAEAAYNKLFAVFNTKNINNAEAQSSNPVNICKYVSSFDKGFQKKQHDSALAPGDIIVATNLAGRGTDFKISEQLANNGGLHVILGYMPANARVEAQIEGRVARAGQPGSFQFVMWDSSVSVRQSDVSSELCRLKVKRDDRECRRLEHIRTRGLQKIFLEEKFFKRFHDEIYNEVKKVLGSKSCSPSSDTELQLKFLTNQWALWLDDNSEHIENIHVRKTDTVNANFELFKRDCLELAGSSTNQSVARFASTPSELLTLGDFYETIKGMEYKANVCYEKVVKKEPDACPVALIRQVKLILHEAGSDKKKQSKPLLTRAKHLIEKRIEQLSMCNDLIKKTFEAQEKAGSKTVVNENRFEEQMTNLISLYQVHLTAIDDILGRPVCSSLAMHFPKEEEMRDVLALITDELKCKGLCKPYRLSSRVTVRSPAKSQTVSKDHHGAGAVLWCDYGTTSLQRMIHWPMEIADFESGIIKLIEENRDTLRRSFTKSTLREIVVSQNQLWEMLIKEGYVGQEKLIDYDAISCSALDVESDSAVNEFLKGLPNELENLKTDVVNWLKRHEKKAFDDVAPQLKLDATALAAFQHFLKKNNILVHISHKQGVLTKELVFDPNKKTSPVVGLTGQLAKFDQLIAMWILEKAQDNLGEPAFKKVGEVVTREELPCPGDEDKCIDKLWGYLLGEGVIKEPKVIFAPGLNANKEDVNKRSAEIKESIESVTDQLKDVCWKYRPPPKPITEHSMFYDTPSYWTDKAWNFAGSTLNSVNPFGGDTKSDSTATNVDEWLTEKQNNEHLKTYQCDIVSALVSSIGHLRTIPNVNTTLQPLSDYFVSDTSRTYPVDEIQSLSDKLFAGVIKLELHKTWWDYWDRRAFYVAMAGIAQVALGVALTAMSGGLLAIVGKTLIAEGVGDIGFAIQAGLSGTFSWESYKSHKIWSLTMSVATAGLGAYLTKGATAGRLAAMGFQGKAGLALCWAATKKALAKCAQAIMSTMTSMGVEKLLSWLKKFVIENVLSHVKFLISKALWFLFDWLASALDQLWNLLKKMGRSVEDVKRIIDGYLEKAKSSELYTLWGRRVAGQASSLGSAMGRCFSESGDVLKAEGNIQLKENEKASGLDSLKDSFKLVGYAQKATKIVGWIKNGSEILGLISYAPEYVKNVESCLSEEVRKLEAEKLEAEKLDAQSKQNVTENTSSVNNDSFTETEELSGSILTKENEFTTNHSMYNVASTMQSEAQVFNEYKQKIIGKVENDVVTYMVDSVTKTWVQPWLQSKIEGLVVSAGKRTFKSIGNLWNGSQSESTSNQGLASEIEGKSEQEIQKEESEKKAAVAEKKLDDSLGEGNTQKQTDENGNTVVQPKDYKEVVEGMGNGLPAGLLQMQIVANATNCTLEIIDKTEEQDFKSENGQFKITPDGSSEKTIQLVYTKNADGTKHVALIGPDGKEMDLPPSFVNADGTPAPPNRCLYEAVACGLGYSKPDDLLAVVKQQALNDKLAQYLYDEKVNDALPHMRVGRRSEGEPANLYFLQDENGNVLHVLTSITAKNLKGGTEVTTAARKELKNDEERKDDDQCGHLIGFLLGGKGGKKMHNIVNLDSSLNQGPYKQLELGLAKFFKDHPDGKIDIDIKLEGNITRPLNVTYSWRFSDKDGHATSVNSVFFVNDPAYIQQNVAAYNFKCQETSIHRVNMDKGIPKAEVVEFDGTHRPVDSKLRLTSPENFVSKKTEAKEGKIIELDDGEKLVEKNKRRSNN